MTSPSSAAAAAAGSSSSSSESSRRVAVGGGVERPPTHRERAKQQTQVRVRQTQPFLAVPEPGQRVALVRVERSRRARAASRAQPRAPTRRAHLPDRLETSPAQPRELGGVRDRREGRDAQQPFAFQQIARRAQRLALAIHVRRGDRIPRAVPSHQAPRGMTKQMHLIRVQKIVW